MTVTVDSTLFEIWSYPGHAFNLDPYKKALISSYQFITDNLGDFPYQEVRLVEIPYYKGDFFAFPNSICISEKEGWYADTTGLEERAYLLQTAASLMITLWINANIKIANVQGAQMLNEALPEALALQIVKKELGEEAVDLILQKKSDLYNKDRYSEPNKEPLLLYADGADYLERNKGEMALHEMIKIMGANEFLKASQTWLYSKKNEFVSFSEFYNYLKSGLNPEKRKAIEALFES